MTHDTDARVKKNCFTLYSNNLTAWGRWLWYRKIFIPILYGIGGLQAEKPPKLPLWCKQQAQMSHNHGHQWLKSVRISIIANKLNLFSIRPTKEKLKGREIVLELYLCINMVPKLLNWLWWIIIGNINFIQNWVLDYFIGL